MRRLIPLAALLATTACSVDAPDCAPTAMHAKDADKVDLGAPLGSAVVTAILSADGEPLGGFDVSFSILDDDKTVHRALATTNEHGSASVDLKRTSTDVLIALARADAFRASFSGDGTYCRSSDDAAFHTIRR